MKGYEVLGVVFETADKLTEEGNEGWDGSINDFVSASVVVCDRLSSQDVEVLVARRKTASQRNERFIVPHGRERDFLLQFRWNTTDNRTTHPLHGGVR